MGCFFFILLLFQVTCSHSLQNQANNLATYRTNGVDCEKRSVQVDSSKRIFCDFQSSLLLTIHISRQLSTNETIQLHSVNGRELFSYSSSYKQLFIKECILKDNYQLSFNVDGKDLQVQIWTSQRKVSSLIYESVILSPIFIPLSFHDGYHTKLQTESLPCLPYEYYMTLRFSMDSTFSSFSYQLKKDSQIILSSDTNPLRSGIFSHSVCLSPRQYILTLGNEHNTGWNGNYVDVLLDGMPILHGTLYMNLASDSFLVNVDYSVSPHFSSWSYLLSGTPPISWTTNRESSSEWLIAHPSFFPTASQTTQYYVTSFSIDSVQKYSFIRVSCTVYAGAIVYLNGNEIGRVNMPSGPISDNTLASKEFSTPTIVTFSVIITEAFVLLTNVLAIELHKFNKQETTNSFDASLILIPKEVSYNVLFDGSPTSKPFNGDISKLFDMRPISVFNFNNLCNETSVFWRYDNHFIIVNHYLITPSSQCLSSSPTGWTVEGSNDGIFWTLLDVRKNIQFSAIQQYHFRFYNMKAFSSYRFRATSCVLSSCSNAALADILLFTDSLSIGCVDDRGEFPPALINEYSYLACPDYATGYQSCFCSKIGFRNCGNTCNPLPPVRIDYPFSVVHLVVNEECEPIVPHVEAWLFVATIYPYLPEGLQIDSSTGIISGTPLSLSEEVEYTVTVTNTKGTTNTVLRIGVIRSTSNLSIFVIFEVVILFFIICIVIYIVRVLRSRKHQRLRKQ